MRRTFILFMLMMVGAGMFAQSVVLSFTGRGSGGNVTEEIYQQIDSLQVRNITRHWDQMIYYPDTVIVMEALAVPTLNVKNSGFAQNVPNPFDCVTEADLTLLSGDVVLVKVVDANGREYAEFSGNLPAGTHKFEITLAVPQTYFLTAVTSAGKYSVKMVNLGSCGINRLSLKSSSDLDISSKGIITNEFSLGDDMEYYAFTTYNNRVFTGSRFQTQDGSEDITIHFIIPYCDRTFNVDYKYGCESYTWIDGVTYTETNHNAARLNLVSDGGCDSIVLLDVTIDHPFNVDQYITACEPITWNGQYCSAAGTYYADLQSQSGCDSTVTLHLNRTDEVRHDIYESDCESVIWNGVAYTETGEYRQTFQTQYGCDSVVTLHFTNTSDYVVDSIHACDEYRWVNGRMYYSDNNTDTVHLINQYGCDSIVRLNLTMGHSHPNTIERTACMVFNYYDSTYTESGTYTQHLTTLSGCDSIVTLVLTITSQVEDDLYETGCDSFVYNGHTYTESGNYDVHFTTPVGCDSIVHLHLNIVHSTYSEQTVVACDSYTWLDTILYQSGVYERTLYHGNSVGCDSVITLHLTVNHSQSSEKNIYACQEYMLDGEHITETGDYVRTYTATNTCDSTVTYHINILDDVSTEFNMFACGPYTWEGTTYTESGDYVKHFDSFVGCDSAVTMHLFIGTPNYDIDDYKVVCDSYEWEGTTYTITGDYTKTLQNIYNCDSVVTLHLTVNTSYTMTLSHTACDSYEWEGTTYTESGTYVKTLQSVAGCDSVVTMNLTINYAVYHEFSDTSCGTYIWDGRSYSASGDYQYTYQAANGCDSIVTLHLVYHELVVDERDGNTYCTMEYGDQVWMTENMRYLPQVDNTISNTDPKYYVYGYTGTSLATALAKPNYSTYGTLYNNASAQTACPEGWHLPSTDEWETLINYLSENDEFICGNNTDYIAKSIASTTLWNESSNDCAVGNMQEQNNTSGFNGLPGGYLSSSQTNIQTNSFAAIHNEADWWTSTSNYRLKIANDASETDVRTVGRHWGLSVRCVKDSE